MPFSKTPVVKCRWVLYVFARCRHEFMDSFNCCNSHITQTHMIFGSHLNAMLSNVDIEIRFWRIFSTYIFCNRHERQQLSIEQYLDDSDFIKSQWAKIEYKNVKYPAGTTIIGTGLCNEWHSILCEKNTRFWDCTLYKHILCHCLLAGWLIQCLVFLSIHFHPKAIC